MAPRRTTEFDIAYVCAHLRGADVEEQTATRFAGDDTAAALERDIVGAIDSAILNFCFDDRDGNPATILTAYLHSPGVARLHRISTEKWPEVAHEVFRYGIEFFMPALGASVHRAQCMVLEKYRDAGEILKRLGFVHEGIAMARGRERQDFVNYAWIKAIAAEEADPPSPAASAGRG